jgi:hypothetical protein
MQRLRTMWYRDLLQWIDRDPGRAELARRARNYERGWAWSVTRAA